MGLHWGAPILQTLITSEAWTRIQTVQVDPNEPTKPLDTLRFLNSATGEELGAANIDYFYRLVRSKLRVLLSENIDVRFDKKLSDITYSDDGRLATAHFEDGTSTTGRILIGADGARSAVRRVVVGHDSHLSRRLSFGATFAQARFTREQALHLRSWHPLYLAGVHPAGRFSFFGMQDGSDATRPETWLFFFYISFSLPHAEQEAMASWTQPQHMAYIKSLARECADPWKSAFEWLPDDHPLWFMVITDWDPAAPEHSWDNHAGRTTLVGDAAHVMTYQRGQGLNQSIADAAKVLAAIQSFWSENEEKRAEVIGEYEKEMKERAGTEVRMGTANTEMLHNWEKALQSPVFKKGLNKS
jgi:2-polyprenyl-6-methoxyphenol hydroxylase-like FAD-dependent oxidoreductase